ncbi:hypothetical protein BGZ49_007696 [Haplosporangium sp. Z 27]|nr:hypothetical protein BGZ49_007696 [Haplosporangium sp. Z 27]
MPAQCQFFLSKKGCRNGSNCRFLHSPDPSLTTSIATTTTATDSSAIVTPITRRIPSTRAPVSKPIPKSLQNIDLNHAPSSLRSFEISQVQNRFKSTFLVKGNDTKDSVIDYNNNDIFELKIPPSDPDFPYEIETLHIQLNIPLDYPKTPCSLLVLNSDIPKGFSTNLERGFAQAAIQKKSILAHLNWLDINMEQLLQKPPAPTIRFVGHGQQTPVSTQSLSLPPTLPPSLPPALPSSLPSPQKSASTTSPALTSVSSVSDSLRPTSAGSLTQKVFTAEQIEQAAQQRQKQLNQIQARFRASFAAISPTEFQISLESTDKTGIIVTWQGPLWVNLLVPRMFPLDPCEIRLKQDGHNPEIELWRARNVEQGFRKIVASMPQLSLFQLLNQLNRDLKDLINMPEPVAAKPVNEPLEQPSTPVHHTDSASTQPSDVSRGKVVDNKLDLSSRNTKLIFVDAPYQPPRKNFEHLGDHGEVTSEDDDDDNTSDTDSDADVEHQRNPGQVAQFEKDIDETQHSSSDDQSEADDKRKPSSTSFGAPLGGEAPKRGVEIRMPDLKLEHISLMYCRLLNLLVRCNRCKGLFEVPDLVPDDGQSNKLGTDTRKWRTCDNCQSLLGAHFRSEYIHEQSKTIGYLDLAGCTAYDILPSAFVPSCGECDQVLGASIEEQTAPTDISASSSESTAIPESSSSTQAQKSTLNHSAPTGFRQRVGRGMSSTANCRKCHARMTFSMEGEIKFVKLSPGDLMKASSTTLEQLPLRKKLVQKNKTGLDFELKVGEPLPRKGACDHYKKSRRWFRFPCCSKIYPCHICHDEKESDSHECEYAKRMVCGHCSREQNVSDKPCVCGESPVRVSGGSGAFWEGGEGMRDKTRMSHKDPRKYRGSNKTLAKKQVGAENVRKRAPKS